MLITIDQNSLQRSQEGNKTVIRGKIAAFPTNYQQLDRPRVQSNNIGLSRFDFFHILDNEQGYGFDGQVSPDTLSASIGVFTTAATEVPNTTDLSFLVGVEFEAVGA